MREKYIILLGCLIILFITASCIYTKTVKIGSTPQGAEIYVRDEKMGLTPQDKVEIKYDTINPNVAVEVRKGGYRAEKKILNLQNVNDRGTVSFNLQEDARTVKIESMPPEAEVYVRGERMGWTPQDKIELKYDPSNPKITIEVCKKGFRPEKRLLEFQDVKDKGSILFDLSEEKRPMALDSEPQGAEVYINDLQIGKTPLKHEVSFVKPMTGELLNIVVKARKDRYETEEGKEWAEAVLTFDEPKEKLLFKFKLKKETETVIHEIKIKEDVESGVKKFVLKEKKVIAELDVIERSPNVKSVTQVTNFQGKVEVGDPVLSPDGSILISQARSLEKEGLLPPAYLWSLNLTGGTGVTTITHAKGNLGDIEPAFNPDGKYIYFASDREGDSLALWRIKSTGSGGLTKITSSKASDRETHISPEGSMLIYSSLPQNAEYKQVWTINVTGFLPTQLKEGHSPKWSPDGTSIAFVVEDKSTGREKIWVMNADGSNPTQLTFSGDYDDITPSWSPDGKKIVFASNRGRDLKGRSNFDIWAMNADGSEVTQLTTNGSLDDHPVWDPKEKYIYFRSNRGGFLEIWRTDVQDIYKVESKQATQSN